MSEAINAVVVYEEPPKLDLIAKGKNYAATVNGVQLTLNRDEDFGKVGKAKKPSLFKAGAEKVIWAYKLLERYSLESKHEDHTNGYYFYGFRCDLVTLLPDGREVVVKSGWGSANTGESRCGFQKAADAANGSLKMAKKRAQVDAAISIARLSGAFTQDIENDEFMDGAKAGISTDSPESSISPQQTKRMFAIAGNRGLTNEQAKRIIAKCGFASSKDVKQKDYDRVCKAIEEEPINV